MQTLNSSASNSNICPKSPATGEIYPVRLQSSPWPRSLCEKDPPQMVTQTLSDCDSLKDLTDGTTHSRFTGKHLWRLWSCPSYLYSRATSSSIWWPDVAQGPKSWARWTHFSPQINWKTRSSISTNAKNRASSRPTTRVILRKNLAERNLATTLVSVQVWRLRTR